MEVTTTTKTRRRSLSHESPTVVKRTIAQTQKGVRPKKNSIVISRSKDAKRSNLSSNPTLTTSDSELLSDSDVDPSLNHSTSPSASMQLAASTHPDMLSKEPDATSFKVSTPPTTTVLIPNPMNSQPVYAYGNNMVLPPSTGFESTGFNINGPAESLVLQNPVTGAISTVNTVVHKQPTMVMVPTPLIQAGATVVTPPATSLVVSAGGLNGNSENNHLLNASKTTVKMVNPDSAPSSTSIPTVHFQNPPVSSTVVIPTIATHARTSLPALRVDFSSLPSFGISVGMILFDVLRSLIFGIAWIIYLIIASVMTTIRTFFAVMPYLPNLLFDTPVLLSRIPILYPHLPVLLPHMQQLSPYLPRLLPHANVLLPYVNLWAPHLPVIIPNLDVLIPYINQLHNQLPFILPYAPYFAPHLPILAPYLPRLIPHFPHLIPYLPECQKFLPKIVPHVKDLINYLPQIERNISLIIPNLPFISEYFDDFLPYLDKLCPNLEYILPYLSTLKVCYPELRHRGYHIFMRYVEDFIPDLGIIAANMKYILPNLTPELISTDTRISDLHQYSQILTKEFGWGMKYTSKYIAHIPDAIEKEDLPGLLDRVHRVKLMKCFDYDVDSVRKEEYKSEMAVAGYITAGVDDVTSNSSDLSDSEVVMPKRDLIAKSAPDITSGALTDDDGIRTDFEKDSTTDIHSIRNSGKDKNTKTKKRHRLRNFLHRRSTHASRAEQTAHS